jgi:thiol-disulfide isomerase/thioredoxin
MKKSVLILAFIISVALSDGFSQTRGIRFVEKPWSEIKAMAKKENKLIFLDAFATWCGPCKWMAANIFPNDTVGGFFNSNFICVSIDMEKGEGLDLRKKYEVRYYPTLLFIDSAGNLIHQKVGAAQDVRDYINMGKAALDPRESLSGYLKRYNGGENSDAFIQTLLLRFSDAYLPVQPVLQKYFASKSESDLLSRPCWTIIRNFVNDMDAPQFRFLVKHELDYGKLFGKDTVDRKISEVFLTALMKQTRASFKTDTLYKNMKIKILKSGYSGVDKVIFTADMNFYRARMDNKKFLDLVGKDLEKYYFDDYNVLNSVAWTVSEICSKNKTEDSNYLNKALGWAKRSVELKSEPSNINTYATLLFMTGNTADAIKYEQAAIDLAKKLSLPSKEYEDALQKMMNPSEIKKP